VGKSLAKSDSSVCTAVIPTGSTRHLSPHSKIVGSGCETRQNEAQTNASALEQHAHAAHPAALCGWLQARSKRVAVAWRPGLCTAHRRSVDLDSVEGSCRSKEPGLKVSNTHASSVSTPAAPWAFQHNKAHGVLVMPRRQLAKRKARRHSGFGAPLPTAAWLMDWIVGEDGEQAVRTGQQGAGTCGGVLLGRGIVPDELRRRVDLEAGALRVAGDQHPLPRPAAVKLHL